VSSSQDKTTAPKTQSPRRMARSLHSDLTRFVQPFLEELDRKLDRRLVQTFLATLVAILSLRNRQFGLLLSELGGVILSPSHAPAGTKRISNLLRSPNWTSDLLKNWFWSQAEQRHQQLQADGQTPFVLWDGSVWEKPETLKQDDFCAVRSAKAKRLCRIRKGFYNPPSGRPICVPGLEWFALLLTAPHSHATLICMNWWTKRGPKATSKMEHHLAALAQVARRWGRSVIHIFDREYASEPWLNHLFEHDCRFIVRWKKGQKLLDSWGEERKAWEIVRGKRSWENKLLKAAKGKEIKLGVYACPVNHPDHPQNLWLVVARNTGVSEPWYLLTTEDAHTPELAWQVIYGYAKRWQIESFWRYHKSALAIESPRVWSWDRREKLLLMVSLVYAFLLSLLDTLRLECSQRLLDLWAKRTGRRNRECTFPLYRLRDAIARLFTAALPPPGTIPLKSSG
jgi:hypothetical protein